MDGFTPDEVVALMLHQQGTNVLGQPVHAYTCPNRGDVRHRHILADVGTLIPTTRGWICPFCPYTQPARPVAQQAA